MTFKANSQSLKRRRRELKPALKISLFLLEVTKEMNFNLATTSSNSRVAFLNISGFQT
jgi:hypothetical protein